jgi:hypothetical protein
MSEWMKCFVVTMEGGEREGGREEGEQTNEGLSFIVDDNQRK